jgi:hypothetical protein
VIHVVQIAHGPPHGRLDKSAQGSGHIHIHHHAAPIWDLLQHLPYGAGVGTEARRFLRPRHGLHNCRLESGWGPGYVGPAEVAPQQVDRVQRLGCITQRGSQGPKLCGFQQMKCIALAHRAVHTFAAYSVVAPL